MRLKQIILIKSHYKDKWQSIEERIEDRIKAVAKSVWLPYYTKTETINSGIDLPLLNTLAKVALVGKITQILNFFLATEARRKSP
ncbi:hypothetical protein [Helicobacter bilis]|uniref:Uncharacterized protein n=2 Tax=Helicobacter bilis TaxID=37372 RepID=A0A6D2C9N4_9HELI|nr:hypothetical protein [Helicobacter bilis]EMZ39286.1 hypothetical protein C826_01262 [Helicobacter bilis WiWa]TLE05207.1 hypothetical protein LS77_004045 [Helicobacter bilis]TLE06360.1 hypothetical protein LS76_003340 [Helicobacter bilis]